MADKETFEQSLKSLEETVEQLEKGDLPLEEALTRFEEGVKAAGNCQKLLREAELKVEKLRLGDDGTLTAEPFPMDENGE